MKFTFYINSEKEVQAVSFEHEGTSHCSADCRNFEIECVSVHFSRTTQDSQMQELMDKTIAMKFNTKVEVEISDEVLEFDLQPHGISGIYINRENLPF
jgi:hypothetical protein